jgi:hypothetical protein
MLRTARDESASGVAAARQINEVYALIDTNKDIWHFGIANLAKADAAFAARR